MEIHKLIYNNDIYVMPYNPKDRAVLSLGEPDGDYYQVTAKNKTDNRLYNLRYKIQNDKEEIDWQKPTAVQSYC